MAFVYKFSNQLDAVFLHSNNFSCIKLFPSVFCSLDISEEYDALLTSSVDCTVRMWTLNGHFIGMKCYFLFSSGNLMAK